MKFWPYLVSSQRGGYKNNNINNNTSNIFSVHWDKKIIENTWRKKKLWGEQTKVDNQQTSWQF